ncbi:MAG: pyridoxamine 5'-phosphate oxidase family protein [Thermocrispum sp.]
MKHSLRLARMARMDLTPNPPDEPDDDAPADRSPDVPARVIPDDDLPTERLPVVRPPSFGEIEPPPDPLGGEPTALPGSAGEHLLQLAYRTRPRAQRFYDDQVADRLNQTMIEFVGRMEMAFIATADLRGEADCSLRAGPPGFIKVLDDRHVAYPEYRGNGVLASLGNISENPHVGIMMLDFVRDRIGLHVNGRAMIVEDDVMRTEFPGLPEEPERGRRAQRWVLVEVDEAYIHCRKHIPAMLRVDADQAWGTDDAKRKGGDYFGVRADRRTAAEAPACAVDGNGRVAEIS